MKRNINVSDALNLSVAERIEIVEDIWDNIAEIPEKIELTDAQKVLLDERLKAYHRNPNEGFPWEVAKKKNPG